MFDDEYLKFDVDDELDAILKAKKFVSNVCKPHTFPLFIKEEIKELPPPKKDSIQSQDQLGLFINRLDSEEEKKPGNNILNRVSNRTSVRISIDNNSKSTPDSSLFFTTRTVSKGSNSGSSGSSRPRQARVSMFTKAIR